MKPDARARCAGRCAARRARIGLLLAALVVLAGAGCDREPPPVLGEVGSFSLVSHRGQELTQESVRGRVWIAAFMFTRCPTICPRLTRTMRSIQERARERGIDLELVSFTVDPEHDTPAVLKRYAEEHGVDPSNWTFATGDLAEIQRTAEQGFKTAMVSEPNADEEHFGITHSGHLMLVDQNLRIRGYYPSSDSEAVAKLLEDAAALAD